MKTFSFIATILAFASLLSCQTGKGNLAAYDTEPGSGAQVLPLDRGKRGGQVSYIPKAVIYKTNANYDSLVYFNMNVAGTQILSYPAPTDITPQSAPVPLLGGWLLDRRGGVGYNTVFTHWTWQQYAALPQAPTPVELLENTIRGARVTAVEPLPFNINEVTPALADSVIRARGLAK